MAAQQLQESIYNLLPVTRAEEEKPSRYVSTFRALVKHEAQERLKEQRKTMGVPKLQVPNPKHFLRKRSKEPKLPKRQQCHSKPQELRVPQRTEPPIMGVQSGKDFIRTNIAEAIVGVAKKPTQGCVDERHGDRFLLDNSGLVQKYIKKKDFGITPKYVTKRKEAAMRAQDDTQARIQESVQLKAPKRVSKREREALLEGLKKNWEELNKAFQNLSVVIDTFQRKLLKEKLEVQMKKLEHDINTLEKYPVIYVANK